jgi:hypothetical protein
MTRREAGAVDPAARPAGSRSPGFTVHNDFMQRTAGRLAGVMFTAALAGRR